MMNARCAVALVFLGAARTQAAVSNLYCGPTDCVTSNPQSAYSICNSAVLDGVIPPGLVGVHPDLPTAQSVIDYCLSFCEDGSRAGFGGGGVDGAVWDACSGCSTTITDDICAICATSSDEVGFCRDASEVSSPSCTIQNGDPDGASADEEWIATTTTVEECRDTVLFHRPSAGGFAWSTISGNCYAEFQPEYLSDYGVSNYQSCIFAANSGGGGGLIIQGNGGSGSGGSGAENRGGGYDGYGYGDGSEGDGKKSKKGKKGKKGQGATLTAYRLGPAQEATLTAAAAMMICGAILMAYKRRRWSQVDGVEAMNPVLEKAPLLDSEEQPSLYSGNLPTGVQDAKPLLI